VLGCRGSWCRVVWCGLIGFASASYLARGGEAYAYAPPVYIALPPVVSFGIQFGSGPRWYRGRDWHRRGSWHGRRGGRHGRAWRRRNSVTPWLDHRAGNGPLIAVGGHLMASL
jgi:hypothetical protein